LTTTVHLREYALLIHIAILPVSSCLARYDIAGHCRHRAHHRHGRGSNVLIYERIRGENTRASIISSPRSGFTRAFRNHRDSQSQQW
jgi:hypothetical protein